jgi:hypothetical protein
MGDLGRTLAISGRYVEARDVLREALDLLLDIGETDRAFDVGDDLGVVLRTLGDRNAVARLNERLRSMLPEGDSMAFVNFQADQALEMVLKPDYPGALATVERVTDACERMGVPIPNKALQALGMAKLGTGDRQGERPLREAFERCMAQGNFAGAFGALFNISSSLASFEPVRALAISDELIELAVTRGADSLAFEARAGKLGYAFELGRFSVVMEEYPAVLAWGIEHEHHNVRLLTLAAVAAMDEADGSTRVDLTDFVDGARSSGDSYLLSDACSLAYARDDRELALALLVQVLSGPTAANEVYGLARVATGLGRVDLIRPLVSRAPIETPVEIAGRHLAEGFIAESDRDHDVAHDSFRLAADAFAELGLAPAEIRSLIAAGSSLLVLGRREEADVVLHRARTLSETIGARVYSADIDRMTRTRATAD